MDNLDLDIRNYDLEDILNVFHLSYRFTEHDLKAAYKIMLKTHPDKSGLDKEVFLFFRKAYDILSKIYYFRQRKSKSVHEAEYKADRQLSNEQTRILMSLNGKGVDEFNRWFNKMFDKTRVSDADMDTGYGKWYKDYHDIEPKQVSLSDFGNEFEKKKQECKALVKKEELQEISNCGGYTLSRDAPKEYSSDVFSKLNYEDLKKAHTLTVIPVTREDFDRHKQFKSVDNYKKFRNSQNTTPLSLQQSRQYLRRREAESEEVDARRIYSILKRDEEVADSNQKWWGYLRKLTDI